MKNVLIFLAEGFEEIEAVTPLDLLRRIDINAKFVSISGNRQVAGAHGVQYTADMLFDLDKAKDADAIVLPGGLPGAYHLRDHKGVQELIQHFHQEQKIIGAICAAPMILGGLGILEGKHATIYPGMEEHLTGAIVSHESVCTDGHITTSRAPGTSVDFALRLARELAGAQKEQWLIDDIVYQKS